MNPTANIWTLALTSAVVAGVISAVINGVFNWKLKRLELRERRLDVAAQLTRLNQERYLEVMRRDPNSSGQIQDPAKVLRFYLADLDVIDKTRASLKADWAQIQKGDR